SILGGERLSSEAILGNPYVFQAESSPNVAVATGSPNRVKTERIGLDGRYRRAVPTGLLTFTSEVSGGGDDGEAVFMQLYQAEYLLASRRWGLATQYRRFQQDGLGADASLIGEVSWYFRNDVGNSNLHWIKLNVERHVERMQGSPRLVITLQYYFYR
ncbi:MAG TPA: hypothetical protein VJY33_12555, partial [Isosphaeraceae bacterium]|nr:hypothetical protein [Isosphaeraceae bacterium]